MLVDIAASRRRLGQSPSHRLVAAVGGKTRRNRVAVLLAQVARRTEALLVCQSAAQELAQLARDDGAMREEILLANGDVALVRTLKSAVSDPQLLRWLLLALAHLAVDGRTRQRQKSAVPRMAQLLESGVPAVAEASARALLALAPCAACHEVMLRYGGPDTLATAQRVQAASGAAASAPSPARKAAGEAPDSGAAALRGRSTREELLAEQAAGEARVGRSAVAIQARTRGMRARKLAAGESQVRAPPRSRQPRRRATRVHAAARARPALRPCADVPRALGTPRQRRRAPALCRSRRRRPPWPQTGPQSGPQPGSCC